MALLRTKKMPVRYVYIRVYFIIYHIIQTFKMIFRLPSDYLSYTTYRMNPREY